MQHSAPLQTSYFVDKWRWAPRQVRPAPGLCLYSAGMGTEGQRKRTHFNRNSRGETHKLQNIQLLRNIITNINIKRAKKMNEMTLMGHRLITRHHLWARNRGCYVFLRPLRGSIYTWNRFAAEATRLHSGSADLFRGIFCELGGRGDPSSRAWAEQTLQRHCCVGSIKKMGAHSSRQGSWTRRQRCARDPTPSWLWTGTIIEACRGDQSFIGSLIGMNPKTFVFWVVFFQV